MTAPAFEFTDRARPIVELGRSARHDTGNRWGEGTWDSGLWGLRDWEVIWTDLTCEIHQIDVDVGRGGATDRFVPGTATITASNVNQISEMIFPAVSDPEGWPFGLELVPQPPITHEENLQAPTADTVVSNGWSFSDDFETAPRWIFPAAWADTGTAPYGPLKPVAGGFEPELYLTGTNNHVGNGAAQWTGSYDPTGNSRIDVEFTGPVWPATPTSGSPQIVVDLMLRMNKTTKECDCARFTLTPNFAGANTVRIDLFHMGPTGVIVAGVNSTHTIGTGTGGVFGTRTLSARYDFNGLLFASMSGVFTDLSWSVDSRLDGYRIGMAVHYVQGTLTTGVAAPPRIAVVAGEDFADDLTFPLGSGWVLPAVWRQDGFGPMIQTGGAMTPAQLFVDTQGGTYTGYGMAQWVSEFAGDQFVEVEITAMSAPRPSGSTNTQTYLELYTHANRHNRACQVAYVNYDPGWGASNSVINWSFWQYGPSGEIVDYAPTVTGTINLGPTNGVFPEPARWRVESDLTGEQRLYYNSTLLATVTAPHPEIGGRVGLHANWRADNLFPNGARRPDVVRVDRFSGGLQEPLGTEELGLWVRIGVDHQTLGRQWMFRGFVDGVVPTYDPERPDKVRIECFDSLGEAGRVPVNGDELPHPFAAAPDRIRQILTAASWPKHFRTIFDDATIMSRPSGTKAVDGLTQVAESCGGAVYGDPETGHVVFKGQDWQGPAAGAPPLAYITNHHPDFEPGIPRVCPSSWERTSQRQDMNTRVKFSTVTSETDDGDPIVKEWRWPSAERLYGVEKYERTLICTDFLQVNELAFRQLRLRNPNQYPRVEAVVLDAATADEALDLMTTATFTRPSKYQCQHRAGDGFVFNRNMLVTGVSHQMTPDSWTCRLALDPSHVFADVGGRWDEARWGVDEWGRAR